MKRKDAEKLLNSIATKRPSRNKDEVNLLSKGEGFVLIYLDSEGGRPVKAGKIALEAGFSTARATSILNSLQKKELIYRFKDTSDSRITYVLLSEKGKAIVRKRKEKAIDWIIFLSDNLGEKEVKRFFQTAAKISTLMENQCKKTNTVKEKEEK